MPPYSWTVSVPRAVSVTPGKGGDGGSQTGPAEPPCPQPGPLPGWAPRTDRQAGGCPRLAVCRAHPVLQQVPPLSVGTTAGALGQPCGHLARRHAWPLQAGGGEPLQRSLWSPRAASAPQSRGCGCHKRLRASATTQPPACPSSARSLTSRPSGHLSLPHAAAPRAALPQPWAEGPLCAEGTVRNEASPCPEVAPRAEGTSPVLAT